MAMDGAVPAIIVLALGAGALGGPDALRLLMELAGRNWNPAFDIGIVVFLISMFAVQLLGTLQLARYVRKAPPAGAASAPRAPATDCFARITLVLSLAAAVLVTACLVLVSGGPGSVRPLVDFAAEYCYPVVIAAGAAVPCIAPLLRALRVQRNARRGIDPAERAARPHPAARFIAMSLLAAGCALLVAGGLGSPSPLVDFAARNTIVAVIVIGGATAAGSLLRTMHPLRAFRELRNARGRAARAEHATTTRHTARSIGMPLAAAAIALLVGGGLASLSLLVDFAAKYPVVIVVVVAVPCITPLLRGWLEA